MIDVKTLHIGSHVEYKGKIVRICSLKTNMANYDELQMMALFIVVFVRLLQACITPRSGCARKSSLKLSLSLASVIINLSVTIGKFSTILAEIIPYVRLFLL